MNLLTTLQELKSLPGFSYVGSPYSKFPSGLDSAADAVAKAAAVLMRGGHRVVSPIAHSHAICRAGRLDPLDWGFWKEQDVALMSAANALIVLRLETWQESVGLTEEIGIFTAAGKPVIHVHPTELGL